MYRKFEISLESPTDRVICQPLRNEGFSLIQSSWHLQFLFKKFKKNILLADDLELIC